MFISWSKSSRGAGGKRWGNTMWHRVILGIFHVFMRNTFPLIMIFMMTMPKTHGAVRILVACLALGAVGVGMKWTNKQSTDKVMYLTTNKLYSTRTWCEVWKMMVLLLWAEERESVNFQRRLRVRQKWRFFWVNRKYFKNLEGVLPNVIPPSPSPIPRESHFVSSLVEVVASGFGLSVSPFHSFAFIILLQRSINHDGKGCLVFGCSLARSCRGRRWRDAPALVSRRRRRRRHQGSVEFRNEKDYYFDTTTYLTVPYQLICRSIDRLIDWLTACFICLTKECSNYL